MILKKELIFTVLATFCLTSVLFLVTPIKSPTTAGEYDPWIDTNNDGIIDYEDLYNLASIYRTSGTPINKTDLLLRLQARVDSLNASVIGLQASLATLDSDVDTLEIEVDGVSASLLELQSIVEALGHRVTTLETDVAALMTDVADLEADISMLETSVGALSVSVLDLISRVEALEAPESVTTSRIADDAVTTDKIDDYAVSYDKLAAWAIPFTHTSSTTSVSTESTLWGVVPGMAVGITLTRTSALIIMFSAMAFAEPGSSMEIRATVNESTAYPTEVTQFASTASGESNEMARSYAFNFYGSVGAGTYIVRILWKSSSPPKKVWAYERSLIVFALPRT